MAKAQPLHALTSLRFFAALAIVFHHTQGSFGFENGFALPFLLGQGVSFFFVLSGFILSHVHPELAPGERLRFLWARFARVWPGHVASALLVLAFASVGIYSGAAFTYTGALANIALLQAWLPWESFYFSLNNVSWTLSVEAFFYATFPMLIHRIDRRWPVWLGVSLMLGVSMAVLAKALAVPTQGADVVTASALVSINPLACWFEFVVGMCAAVAFRRIAPRARFGFGRATLLELLTLAVALAANYFSAAMSAAIGAASGLSPPLFLWLSHGAVAAPAYALLIVVMGLGDGAVSRLLSAPLAVRLGEISYALYLLHYVLLRTAAAKLALATTGLGFVLLLAQLLLASHLLWQCVEVPARRALVALLPLSDAAAPPGRAAGFDRRTFVWTFLAHAGVVIALIAVQRMLAG